MARYEHARGFALLEEALTVLFCAIDDIYQNVNPDGWRYESLKKLSDSEVITLRRQCRACGCVRKRSPRARPWPFAIEGSLEKY
jgi:hypothetical protein